MGKSEMTKEEKVNAEYQKMMEGIRKKVSEGKSEYLDYYAGAYINDDYELTVLLTRETEEIIDTLKKISGNEDIKIKHASYPLSELVELQDVFVSVYEELYENKQKEDCDLLESLTGLYIDEEKNKLVVEIREITEDKKKKFMELFGKEPFITFEEGNKFEWTVGWKPGRAVYSQTGRLSTGYKCVYTAPNGTRYAGFATAGHGFATGAYAYRTGGGQNANIIGTCMQSQFSRSNDVAFIHITNGNYTASDELYYPDGDGNVITISPNMYVTYAAQGANIYKVGSRTGWTDGRIASNWYIVFYRGTVVWRMLKTTALNLGGDSGGCAYMKIGGYNVAAGTMSGSRYRGGGLNADTFISSYISQIRYARRLGIAKN